MNIDNENLKQAEDLFTKEQHARLNAEIPQSIIDLARGEFGELTLAMLVKTIIQQLGSSGTEQYETPSQLVYLIQGNSTLRNLLSAGVQAGNFNAVRHLSKDVSLFTLCTL